MSKELFWLLVLALVLLGIRQAIPDIQRYMRIRAM
jgi:hypothetical protein